MKREPTMTSFKYAGRARAALAAMPWLIVLCVPLAAGAQQADPDAPQAPANAQGPMIVERVHNGFAVAPDFKVSRFDQSDARLAGGYAGWVLNDALLVGGGGYWLTNNSRAHKMAYGGAVIGWLANTGSPIGFGVRGLLGAGQATLAASVSGVPVPVAFDRRRDGRDFPGIDFSRRPGPGDRNVNFDQRFLIFEPQADLFVKIARSIRLDAGVGYRVIGGAEGVENRLRGVTGTIGVQFGGAAKSRRSP